MASSNRRKPLERRDLPSRQRHIAKSRLDFMADALYDTDFFAWTQATARLVREGRFAEVDLKTVAGEIEDMGRRDLRELNSRMSVLIAHLLKWQFQAEHRSPSWRSTVAVQRADIDGLLGQSPSLKRKLASNLATNYERAKVIAAAETGLPGESAFPIRCPYTVSEILSTEFWPGHERNLVTNTP